jgi:hypothetical protein
MTTPAAVQKAIGIVDAFMNTTFGEEVRCSLARDPALEEAERGHAVASAGLVMHIKVTGTGKPVPVQRPIRSAVGIIRAQRTGYRPIWQSVLMIRTLLRAQALTIPLTHVLSFLLRPRVVGSILCK